MFWKYVLIFVGVITFCLITVNAGYSRIHKPQPVFWVRYFGPYIVTVDFFIGMVFNAVFVHYVATSYYKLVSGNTVFIPEFADKHWITGYVIGVVVSLAVIVWIATATLKMIKETYPKFRFKAKYMFFLNNISDATAELGLETLVFALLLQKCGAWIMAIEWLVIFPLTLCFLKRLLIDDIPDQMIKYVKLYG